VGEGPGEDPSRDAALSLHHKPLSTVTPALTQKFIGTYRTRMKTFLVLLALIAGSAHAQSPKFISLSAAFHQFVIESQNADLDKQIDSWKRNVEVQIPEVYLRIIAQDDPAQLDVKRREQAAKTFPFLLAHADQIESQFKIYETDGHAVIDALVAAYPQADMTQTTVIGLPSLNHFNGQVTIIHGKIYALFGMDMIEHIVEDPTFVNGAYLLNDMKVLMAHEFTHALNFVLSDLGQDDNTLAAFFGPLWTEGLAQVNAQMLNPATPLEMVYMEKYLAAACTPQNVGKWSAQYLQDSKGDMDALKAAYVKWINLNPSGLQANGVYRAGYCLGYNVILAALRQYSMAQILSLPRASAYTFVQQTLTEFAATGNSARAELTKN
jgi:hypothetical protein